MFLGKPVPTVCEVWERIGRGIGGAAPAAAGEGAVSITADPLAGLRTLVPACSLTRDEARRQRVRYEKATAAVLDLHREKSQLEVSFSSAVDEEVLSELIETESHCCPFLDMSYDAARRALTVGVADPEHEPALDAVAFGFGGGA
jgi:hypothetical protein